MTTHTPLTREQLLAKPCDMHRQYNAVTCPKCLKAAKWRHELATGTGAYGKRPILKPWEEGRL